MQDLNLKAVELHKKFKGKLGTMSLVKKLDKKTLSLLYTPGVAEPCRIIAKDKNSAYDLTLKGRTVAVISNGTAVLGLGNIGADAALPVMEGKSLLMKQFASIDSFPLVVDTRNSEELIRTVKLIAPTFAGINLEDIAAPACFEIEEALSDIGIPVFHDDQHGTAIVVRAALLNAAKAVDKSYDSLRVVVVGAGSAGLAITRMLLGLNCASSKCEFTLDTPRVKDVIVTDTQGTLYAGRPNQNIYKQAVAGLSNAGRINGSLSQAIKGADAVIGVSKAGAIMPEHIKSMAEKPIVFALANPIPEIMPDEAKKAGAFIIATGRSDFPNQINNVLAFPGIFKAVVDARLKNITLKMKISASDAISKIVKNPSKNNIIPSAFHPNLAKIVAKAVIKAS